MRFRTIAAAFAALVVIAVGIPVGINALQGSNSDRRAAQRAARADLQTAGGGRANRVSDHRKTGLVRFLGTEPGRPIATKRETPVAAARAFLDEYGAAFGVHDLDAQLSVDRANVISSRRAMNKGAVVRMQQEIEDIPVLAGELAIRLDPSNNVMSAIGEILPIRSFDTEPTVPPTAAAERARRAVAKRYDVEMKALLVGSPELWVYSPALLGAPHRDDALVWLTEVSSPEQPIREDVLVDAKTGDIRLRLSKVHEVTNRKVCDQSNNPNITYVCSGAGARFENSTPSGQQDVDQVFDRLGDAHNYFLSRFGRNGIDDSGMQSVATVRVCLPFFGPCPMANAFWDGNQLGFGDDFGTDDVLGHELVHGITQHESALFYYYQSGAINESLSDVFGELIDLASPDAGARWEIGEDIPVLGAARDLSDPTRFGSPDKMTSPLYVNDPADNGGVHTNSGVNNKAAFLIADGGTFNGHTFTGLGLEKTAAVYYELATNGLLTSGSDYADLYDALPQACLSAEGDAGLTAADCTQVTKAVSATEMHLQSPNATAPEAEVCEAGEPEDLFSDDVESSTTKWMPNSIDGEPTWQRITGYSHSGQFSWLGMDDATSTATELTMKTGVDLEANSSPRLWFAHSYGFEEDFDGGVLEYTTNGTDWVDVASLPDVNGYNGTIEETNTGNPLQGREAFVGTSNGYISSRYDLSSLAGSTVLFRFLVATDEAIGDFGWTVDDIRIYTCEEPAQPELSIADAAAVTEGDSGTKTATFTVTKTGPAQAATVNYATSNGTAELADNDYEEATGSLSFAPNETSKTIGVTINGDTKIEPDETFNVSLSSESNATVSRRTAVGTITSDDLARQVNVGDDSAQEGDTLTFRISATNAAEGPVDVTFKTTDGTATAADDYVADTDTVTIPQGDGSVDVTIATKNDTDVEADEAFTLDVTDVSDSGTIGKGEGVGTITDDDGRVLSVSNETVTEGGVVTFDVTATNPDKGAVTFDVETVDGSATAPADYTAIAPEQRTIDAGEQTETVSVTTIDDSVVEGAHDFKLRLSDPSANGIIGNPEGIATITDNDVKREVRISNESVEEGDDIEFTITATNPEAGPVTVEVETSDHDADDDTDSTAEADEDYEATDDTITFTGTKTSETFTVETDDDSEIEEDEFFFALITDVSSNGVLKDDEGKGTIRDDDGDDATPTPTPTGLPGARLTYSPSPLVPGKSATVTGTGFPKSTKVELFIQSEPMFLGSVTTTTAGTFTLVVDIPLLPAGQHTLVALRSADDSTIATSAATVSGQVSTATTAPGVQPVATTRAQAADSTPVPASSLPDTGAQIASIVRYALLAIALGMSTVGVERWLRRRRVG